jgi:hypothetical protein
MIDFMETAATWGELKDVPVVFYRTEELDWFAKLSYRVGSGWRNVHVPFTEMRKKSRKKVTEDGVTRFIEVPAETYAEFRDRVEKTLSMSVQKDRENSIREFTGANPAGKPKAA